MPSFLPALAAVAYLLATVRIARRLVRAPAERPARDVHTCAVAWCGAVLHAAALWPAVAAPGGAVLDLPATVSVAGLALAVVFGAAMLWRIDYGIGALVLPLAGVAALVPLAWPGPAVPAGAGAARVHAALSLVTYAVLTLAAIQALVLGYQERRIRTRRPGGTLRSLESLETQERWLFRFAGIGFFLLSLSLVSGFMFLHDMFAQHLAHKTVLSCAAWAIFGTLLWGRWRHGWRGQTAVRWCLGGFAVLVLAYFGSRWILEVLLERRWYSA